MMIKEREVFLHGAIVVVNGMGINMMVNGRMIRNMEEVFILTQTVIYMMVSGIMIKDMEEVLFTCRLQSLQQKFRFPRYFVINSSIDLWPWNLKTFQCLKTTAGRYIGDAVRILRNIAKRRNFVGVFFPTFGQK